MALLAMSAPLACEENGDSRCYECFSHQGVCEAGVITYSYSWSLDCGFGCRTSRHACALGCREEGGVENERDLVFMLCEEASLRRAGFPCRHDVDCLSPIGATQASHLLADAGIGQTSASPWLVCGTSGVCDTAAAVALPSDLGRECSTETSDQQPGPVVATNEGCESGACLVLTGGSSNGTCTTGCAGEGECPAGYTCSDVLDNRYVTWSRTGELIAPPRITACVPSTR
jgi:hypothetical protein